MTAYSGRVNLGGTSNDVVDGGNGNDTLLNGGDGADFVSGDRGNDTVLGGSGNDTGLGGDGNDIVLGGDANDSLFGGGGDDSISGDRGADLLTGGARSDTFYFAGVGADYGIDTITECNPGEDKLTFDRNAFCGFGGSFDATNFIVVAGFAPRQRTSQYFEQDRLRATKRFVVLQSRQRRSENCGLTATGDQSEFHRCEQEQLRVVIEKLPVVG